MINLLKIFIIQIYLKTYYYNIYTNEFDYYIRHWIEPLQKLNEINYISESVN